MNPASLKPDAMKRIEYEGTVHEFPAEFTEQDIAKALRAHKAQEPGILANVGKFAGAVWDKVNPVEGVRGLYQAATSPLETGSAILQAHKNLGSRAVDDYQRGDYVNAAIRGLGSLVPLVGPDVVQSYEDLEAGNQAEALGGLAGTLLGMTTLPNRAQRLGSRWVGVPGMDALPPAQRAGVDFLRQRGVQMPAAVLGGGKLPAAAQALGGVSPAGAYLAPKMERATEAGLSRVAKDLGKETHPTSLTPIAAGESAMGALSKKAGQQEKIAARHYEIFNAAAQDPRYTRTVTQRVDAKGNPIEADVSIPVDTQPFRAAAKDLYDHMQALTSSAARHSSNAYAALSGLMSQERYIPAAAAEEILSVLKADARTATGRDAGRLKFLISKFQPVVDNALLNADPSLLRAVQKGRQWTAKQKVTERVHQQLTGVSKTPVEGAQIREPEPVNAYRRITQEGDTRAKLLERIGKLAPKELPKVGRAYVEDILQTWRDTGESLPTQGVATKMWNDWHKLGDEAKKKLFPLPHVRENWDHFFEGVRRIAANPNPSGTATTTMSLGQFGTAAGLYAAGSPVWATLSLIGPSAVAALMYTPRGAALMRKGFRIPAGNIAAATAWSNQVGNMVEQMTRKHAAAAAVR
jgi:hypothetical protein